MIYQRIFNILYAFDCFAFTVCTLGKAYIGESFSSAARRAEKQGKFYGKARPLIDYIASKFGQVDHCEHAYKTAKYDLPADMRE